jgi:tetratricopeptide (TPR) repeat protein
VDGMRDLTQGRVEELRQAALARVRAGDFEPALGLYDEALALTEDEEVQELLTINKADAMIALERPGPEVQALPAILMRRRNLHHAFLAAYALMFKQGEMKRATFYGHVALDAADDAAEPFWKLAALNDLGIIYEIDSQFEDAIECFTRALEMIELVSDRETHKLAYGTALQNLGASNLARLHRLPHRAGGGLHRPLLRLHRARRPRAGPLLRQRRAGAGGRTAPDPQRPLPARRGLLQGRRLEGSGVPLRRALKNLLFALDLRSMVNLKL